MRTFPRRASYATAPEKDDTPSPSEDPSEHDPNGGVRPLPGPAVGASRAAAVAGAYRAAAAASTTETTEEPSAAVVVDGIEASAEHELRGVKA